MGEVDPRDHVIFDRRVEPRTIKRLHKDGGKLRVHCGNCLAGAISDQIEEAMAERYQPIQDTPPCLYDRRTKELVRLGTNKEEYLAAMTKIANELLVDLDFHWLANIDTITKVGDSHIATIIKIIVPNGPPVEDDDAPKSGTPRTCN
jgi:hypothetical protein